MHPRSSRKNGYRSDQQLFHQLLKSYERKRLRVAVDSEKKTPWWNQKVKEAIRAKKDAFKALPQDRSSSNLQSGALRPETWHFGRKEIQGEVMGRIWSSVGFQVFFG